jgi:hypothetical protein
LDQGKDGIAPSPDARRAGFDSRTGPGSGGIKCRLRLSGAKPVLSANGAGPSVKTFFHSIYQKR